MSWVAEKNTYAAQIAMIGPSASAGLANGSSASRASTRAVWSTSSQER